MLAGVGSSDGPFKDFINSELPFFSGLRFLRSILLLGYHIGPGAEECQWNRTLSNMAKACERVVALDVGSAASIPLFNALCVSCGAWLAALTPPTKEVLKLEDKLRQKLMRSPWQAIPSRMMPNLKKTCGLPFEVADLSLISIAGRARSALVTATSFNNARRELSDALLGDERVLSVLEQRWLDTSLIRNAEEAINYTNNNAYDIISKFNRSSCKRLFNLQSKLYACLHSSHNFQQLEDVLVIRMRGWIHRDDPEYHLIPPLAKDVAGKFKWLASKAKPCVSFALLKWLTNALCTTARFHKEVLPCLLCGADHGDNIDHIISCPVFVEFASKFWRISLEINRKGLCMLSFLVFP